MTGRRESLVAVGTKKGLFVLRGDPSTQDWQVAGPAAGRRLGVRRGHRHAPHATADPGRDAQRALGPVRHVVGRPRCHVGGAGPRPARLPGGHRRRARARLAAPAGRRGPARRGLGRHRAGRAVPVRGRRPDVRPRPRAVGPPRASALGRRLRRAGRAHGPAAPGRPGPRAGRGVHRRRLRHRGRRRVVALEQHAVSGSASDPRSTRRSGSACTRSTAARRVPTSCSCRTTAASTAATTAARRGRRSRTGCPRTSASRSSRTRTSRGRRTSSRSSPTPTGCRPAAGVGCTGPPTAPRSWQPCGSGIPEGGFWSIPLRDAFTSDAGDPLGLYLGTRSGELWASGDEGDTWSLAVSHLPDVLSVRATVL